MEKRKEPTEFDIRSRERLNYIIAKYCHGSQQELSNRTGVGKASISQYVNGKNTPSNLTAMQLCEPFFINPAWLMGFDAPMKTAIIQPLRDPNDYSLSDDEADLINRYRELNAQGQEKVLDYALDLVKGKQYIKSDKDGMVDEDA